MFIVELFDQLPSLINKTADVDGIQVSINTNAQNATAYASSNGKRLGYAEFDRDGNVLVPYDLAVDDKYRGQGIAAIIYNYVKSLGFTIKASTEQTDAGKYFWKKNRGEERVWEDKTLDPDVYGEMLPTATIKRIITGVMNQVDPMAKVTVKQTPEGYYSVNAEKLRLDFGITADGGDINANIVNAYSSYKGKNVVTEIFGQCFKAAEQLWGKPNRFVMSAHEDRGYGVWQHIAQKLGAEWEGSISEVTLVPSVAKSKREHLDVMPNDGKPIPASEESDHMGDLVAEMGNGYQLWSWVDRGTVTYYVFDTRTRTCQLGTTGRPYKTNRDSFVVQGVYSGPKNRYRAADLYAFLILNRGLTLVSDNKQSEGGYRVWQELEKRYKNINVHGFDTKTDQGVNVTTRDEPDTHVARQDVKSAGPQMKKELGSISRDLRFVASAQ